MDATFDPVAGVDWGTQLESNSVSYYLYTAGQTATDPDIPNTDDPPGGPSPLAVEWNDYEKGEVHAALATFSAVANLNFTPAAQATGSTLRLMLTDLGSAGSLGWFVPPGYGAESGLGAFNVNGNSWSRTADAGTLAPGGDAFDTVVHEIGHGLGLKHPHDQGPGDRPVFPGVTDDESVGTYSLNQSVNSVMSYVPGWTSGPDGASGTFAYGQAMTPMAFDIAALQGKYGANTSYRTGDDTYVLPGQDQAGTGYACIWDAGGNNTISYTGSGSSVINLKPASLAFAPDGGGAVSYVKGVHGGLTIAHGVSIRNAIGGAGDDLLIGNDAGDTFDPGAGANTVVGGNGSDVIRSLAGNDEIFTGSGESSVELGAGADTVIAGSGAATISAGAGLATVFGGSETSRSQIYGGSGQLLFVGGAGAANVVGGSGGGLTVFTGRSSGEFFGSAAGGDLLCAGTGAATLVGGGAGDLLFSSDHSGNVLVAGAGNETLVGSAATGGDLMFTGPVGSNSVVFSNYGADTVCAGSGNATIVGGQNPTCYLFGNGKAGGSDLIYNFRPESDISLQGYALDEPDRVLASAGTSNGSTNFTLSDGTSVTLVGFTGLQRAMFV